MSWRRRLALGAAFVIIGGSLIAHIGFAAYLHSSVYREKVERGLTRFFDLPCNVQSISRRTFSSRVFKGVELWLPDRRDRVFQCEQAIWDEQSSGPTPYIELDLVRGTLALGTDAWLLEDYRRVPESVLRHDFGNLQRVGLEHFNITFQRRGVLLNVRDVDGTVRFDSPDVGVAILQAYELNGQRVREPIRIHARFFTHGAVLIDEVLLEIPEVALSGLALDKALGAPVTRGNFAGRLVVRQGKPPRLTVSGRLYDVDLTELTQRLPSGPLHGVAEVMLDRAEFAGTLPIRVQGRARLSDVPLGDLAPIIGLAKLSGTAGLDISEADVEAGHINRLVISGGMQGVEVADVLAPLGHGGATGRLAVTVNALRIEKDRISSADIDITAVPPAGSKGTIDRELLLSAAEKLAGFAWPSALPKRLLPAQIEYAQFGMRLLVTDNRLRVLGTHGSGNDTILTIRVVGTEFGLVKAWGETIDLTPWVDELLARISAYDPRDVRRLLRSPSSAPSTPAG